MRLTLGSARWQIPTAASRPLLSLCWQWCCRRLHCCTYKPAWQQSSVPLPPLTVLLRAGSDGAPGRGVCSQAYHLWRAGEMAACTECTRVATAPPLPLASAAASSNWLLPSPLERGSCCHACFPLHTIPSFLQKSSAALDMETSEGKGRTMWHLLPTRMHNRVSPAAARGIRMPWLGHAVCAAAECIGRRMLESVQPATHLQPPAIPLPCTACSSG